MKTIVLAIRAILFACVPISLVGWLALSIRRFDPLLGGRFPDWIRPFGVIPFLLGATIAMSCLALFILFGRGTAMPLDPPREFVALGPYRYVRNPMYWGGLLTLAGFALLCLSPAMLVVPAVLIVAVHHFVVLYEEPQLRRRFGTTYLVYCERVHRWWPRRPMPGGPGAEIPPVDDGPVGPENSRQNREAVD